MTKVFLAEYENKYAAVSIENAGVDFWQVCESIADANTNVTSFEI
jgi:hypothetical protein